MTNDTEQQFEIRQLWSGHPGRDVGPAAGRTIAHNVVGFSSTSVVWDGAVEIGRDAEASS